jgi:hypothetical protein
MLALKIFPFTSFEWVGLLFVEKLEPAELGPVEGAVIPRPDY